MSEIVGVFTNDSGSKKATVIKFDHSKYMVQYEELKGPTGDLGYIEPSPNIPKQMYTAAKLAYDLQFESKILVTGSSSFSTLQEANTDAESFVYEDSE